MIQRLLSAHFRFYCILALSELELMGQIVIWREIYRPRDTDDVMSSDEMGYKAPSDGRYFLLIVGMVST